MTGVPHRREAALEGGGGHSTSWSNTGWDAGSSSSSATLDATPHRPNWRAIAVSNYGLGPVYSAAVLFMH